MSDVNWWRLGLIGLAILSPSLAVAETNLCVSDTDTGPDPHCYGAACYEVLPDLPAALEAARALPDVEGERPAVRICMGAELADSGAPYTGSAIIDNREGTYGEPLELVLLRRMCPEPSSSPSQPLLEIVTDGTVEVFGPVARMADCEAGSRPGVAFWGGGVLTLTGFELDGWTGYGVSNGTVGAAGSMNLARGALVNGSGLAISSRDYLNLDGVELAGNRTEGADALVWTSGPLGILDSVLYGNLVVGDSSQALVQGESISAHNTAFIANGVVGGRPLVVTSLSDATYLAGGEPDPHATRVGFQNVVMARNTWLEFEPDVDLQVEPGVFAELGESGCAAIPAEPYWSRQDPFVDQVAGDPGPLVRVVPPLSEQIEDGVFFLVRSFLVGNRMADESIMIEARSLREREAVVLVNNTIADNSGATTALALGSGEGGDVFLLRNLVLSLPEGLAVIDFDEAPDSVVLSLNAGLGEVRWIPPDGDLSQALVGPTIPVEQLSFEEPDDLQSLPDCGRHLAVCPEASAEDCGSTPGGRLYECAPDLAASYLPTQESAQALTAAWPWDTDYFEAPDIAVAGATGWRCFGLRGTWDRWGETGDGDGFPEAVDCDNEDSAIVPGLPEHDGFSSPWCDAGEVECYVCPEGSVPPPRAADDDDDSAGSAGSHCRGCGLSWSCEDGAMMGLLPGLLLIRRRRSGATPGHLGRGQSRGP